MMHTTKTLSLATYLLSTLFLCSCVNELSEVDNLTADLTVSVETATNVDILYSDSAQIKVRISGPTMLRHLDRSYPRDEFPDGVHVEFYDDQGNIMSWLDADYAVREQKKSRIITRQNVRLYNEKNEKLETWELIWDTKEDKIYTDRFVMISQPERGDTSYGYGFVADNDFKRFEIQNNSGKMNISDISKELNGK